MVRGKGGGHGKSVAPFLKFLKLMGIGGIETAESEKELI